VWSTRRPALHCQNTPTAFCCSRRSSFGDPTTVSPLAICPAAYPEDPPARRPGRFRSAENTPGNKLSCSILNLFPSRTHTSVLGNCLSSSTATPPSEHTPLRRRCCSEPFFRLSQTQYGSRSPPPDASFLKEAPPSPGGASAFSALPVEKPVPKFRAIRTTYFQPDAMQDDGVLLTATCS
jgi:hypothetical protein